MKDAPEMVERVARAIQDAESAHRGKPGAAACFGPWERSLIQARTAIEAMRVPTDAMVRENSGLYGDSISPDEARAIYAGMIDAALGKESA